jgi:hypothetical protein
MRTFRTGGLRSLGNQISIPIQTDDDGYLGRECPNEDCEGYFKITPGTGIKGPAPCHCPYCGHEGNQQVFWTKQQIEYAKSVAMSQIVGAFRQGLKALEFDHKPRGAFGIGASMKLKPGAPVPIHRYRENDLETEIICDRCTLRYAIFGVFGWCPDCGVHNSFQILTKNLELAAKKLKLAESLEQDLAATVIADALAGVIAAFDGFGREVCSDPKASFQNLEGGRKRVLDQLGFDMANAVTADEWQSCCGSFQKRHLLAHRMGVVDEEYIKKANDPSAVVGRKIKLDASEIVVLIDIVERVGKRLFDGTMSARNPLPNPNSTP